MLLKALEWQRTHSPSFAAATSRPLEILTKQADAGAGEGLGNHHGNHGRPAPQLPDVAERISAVLAAAERAGSKLPFSLPLRNLCDLPHSNHGRRGGDGVPIAVLERWEIDAGFVLCCQARPTTPTLEISYDQK